MDEIKEGNQKLKNEIQNALEKNKWFIYALLLFPLRC
jgi:hypothetical protein